VDIDTQYSTTRRLVYASQADNACFSFNEHKLYGGLRVLGYHKENLEDKPIITVITVTRNASATLEVAIKSVLSQSYDNIEYIIVDGCSSDKTVDIIRKYNNAIDFWLSEPDGGIYDAMNKAINYSTGEYYIVLGADDVFDENAIESFVDCLLSNNADIVTLDVLTDNGRLTPRGNPFRFCHLAYISQHSVGCLIKKKLHKINGFYSNKFPIGADAFFIKQSIRNGAVVSHSKNIAGWYASSGVSSTNDFWAFFDYARIQLLTEKRFLLTMIYIVIKLIYNYKKLKRSVYKIMSR
jgi:glycosyltransferase involved in cell wall biosynthesis